MEDEQGALALEEVYAIQGFLAASPELPQEAGNDYRMMLNGKLSQSTFRRRTLFGAGRLHLRAFPLGYLQVNY